jgi:hypothetical protein
MKICTPNTVPQYLYISLATMAAVHICKSME